MLPCGPAPLAPLALPRAVYPPGQQPRPPHTELCHGRSQDALARTEDSARVQACMSQPPLSSSSSSFFFF